jgi:SAM-dependent methyltransferase
MFLKKAILPSHKANRMKNEGDVINARDYFYEKKTYQNLFFLLKYRYIWMNQFIKGNHTGLEVGAGTGISKEFIKCKNYFTSDFSNYDYLDYKNVDALNTEFDDEKFDFIISSNMIHHVPYTISFFKEMDRILKPGGKLIIQEINGSFMMRLLLKMMRHEGYNYEINVFNKDQICTNPDDLWSANCVIPNLLFDNIESFENNIQEFKVIHSSHSEFLNFINSGGVIAKTFFIPLPKIGLKLFKKIDDFLSKTYPTIFALQRQIVLEKTKR